MTRLDTRSPSQIKHYRPKNPSICRFSYLAVLGTVLLVAYFIITKPEDSLGDPSDQFVVKTIPKVYTRLEGDCSDEREVFRSFCTSFLPPEEIVFASNDVKTKREVTGGKVTSDILISGNSDKQHDSPPRVKRMSRLTFTSKDNNKKRKRRSGHESLGEEDSEKSEEESEIEYESSDSSGTDYDDDEDLKRAFHPEPHVDRGPLDDVVEQVRGQPELEEEEMGTSAHAYKHGQPFKDIHAFWKGQGDKETIRTTQAKIMRQYMDAGADPCHDFYQYACGNWPALNPIPADKAGYDTFEMLRENLDTVLKELLEFKNNEDVPSIYPGAHLDLDENIIKSFSPPSPPVHEGTDVIGDILEMEKILNGSSVFNPSEESQTAKIDNDTHKIDRSKIFERIRRYLDAKAESLKKLKHKASDLLHRRKSQQGHPNNVENINGKNPNYQKRHANTIETFNDKMSSDTNTQHRNVKYAKTSIDSRIGRKLLMYRRKKKSAMRYPRWKMKRDTTELEENILLNEAVIQDDDDPAHGDAAVKARFLFKSCMNYDILQKRGHQPLLDLLNLFGGWPILNPKWDSSKFDWLELMAKLRLFNNDIFISEWVGPDIKNSDEFVIQFDQTSLGLPTRDYFLQDSNKVYLMAYKNYLLKIAILLGGKSRHVRASADKLIQFEIRLAQITSAPEDRRNVSELYRRMPLRDLEKLVPEVKWRRYLCVVMNRDVQPDETVVMFALSYVRHLVELIKETDSSVLSNYLLWRFVRHRVNNLDDRFQSAKQQFYFILFGREQAPPRWKNCISQVNSNMGMALGSMFVRNYFDETSKNDTLRMTREIQKSFKELLHKTDWIDDKTKGLAAHKIDAMMLRIGYPDFILNKVELDERYKEVKVHPDKYFENILNILQHLAKMEQGRLGQPVNKTLWNTAPAVVNAYYSRNKNQIMFPAGILQPPFYHRHFPRSLNYGGIGVVIGHEITHGFDDKGRLFDSNGNLHRWWSDSAIEAFHRRAQCLIDQYGRYVVSEVNVKLDGVNTQGENIADNGGVKQAFRAYLHWLQHHGSHGETLPGLNHTHTQLFFLNFAQVWCGAMRPEAMRNKLKTAVHSPGRFRVIGTLSNSHDFAREFRCPPGSPMNPRQKCSVW